jgi:hypothetical protein
MPELTIYTMAPETISAAYVINLSHQSVCTFIYMATAQLIAFLYLVLGNGSVNTFPQQ